MHQPSYVLTYLNFVGTNDRSIVYCNKLNKTIATPSMIVSFISLAFNSIFSFLSDVQICIATDAQVFLVSVEISH